MIVKQGEINGQVRIASFSDCEKYRLCLDIIWAEGPILTTVGLNPSTADHLKDDPTIRRGIGYAQQWGYGGYRMLNAFAWRSTDRSALFKVSDPVGADNTLVYIKEHSTKTTIACWGTTIQSRKWPHFYRGHDIAKGIPNLKCFRYAGIHPEHPLYLPKDLQPVPFKYDE